MNNKKGFTLVELLVVIGVLALIVGVAIPTYISIDRQVKKRNYENKIKSIEAAAESFAFNTGETIIMINDLVKQGYLDPDDEIGNIINPVTKESMNCIVVESEKISTYYKSEVIDDKAYIDSTGNCSLTKYLEETGNIIIKVDKTPIKTNSNEFWYTTNNTSNPIILSIEPQNYFNCETDNCLWTSSSGINKSGNTLQINVENGVRNNVEYTFSAIKDNKTYVATKKISIDNEKPILIKSNLIKPNNENYTYVNVTIDGSDGNGSGVAGYYIGKGSCNNSLSFSNEIKKVVDNDTFNICIKDNVGNISDEKSITVNGIKKMIKFDSNGGTAVNDVFYIENGSYYRLPTNNPTKLGYNFKGWLDENNNNISTSSKVDLIGKEGITLIAKWEPIIYTIIYNANGGTNVMNNTSCKYDVACKLNKNVFTRNGYSFAGWNYNNNNYDDESSVQKLTSIDNDTVVLNANWNPINYTITYNLDGGSINNQKTSYTIEDEFTLSTPTKYRYDFTGWTGSNGTSKQTSVKVNKGTTGNLVYTANWKLSDNEPPKCTLKATTSGVTWDKKSDNVGVTSYGLSTSSTPTYNSKTSLTLATGTFYGFVKDAAENKKSCSINIKSTDASYTKTTTYCNESSTPTHKCWKNRTTYTYYQKKTRTCNRTSSTTQTNATSHSCSGLTKTTCTNTTNSGHCQWKGTTSGSCVAKSGMTNTWYTCSSGTLSGTKCNKTTYTYSFGSYGSVTNVSSCSASSFSCTSSYYGSTYTWCSSAMTGYNACPSGTTLYSDGICYTDSYYSGTCPSGFSESRDYTSSTKSYSTSKISTTSSTCSARTSFTTCNSYSAGDNNVSCSTPTYSCPSGYEQLNDSYCYKSINE